MLFRWKDDVTWKRFLSLSHEGGVAEIRSALDEYSSFAAFHACRPSSPDHYYKEGLKIADVDALNRRAAEILLTPEFPNLTNEKFEQAIRAQTRIHDRKVFVMWEDEGFLEFGSSHYLIYGSEHIWRLINGLNGWGMPRTDILKRFGTPTLFEIHIPSDKVNSAQLRGLSNRILAVCEGRDPDERPQLDIGIQFEEALPGSWIRSHWHPEEIPDLAGGISGNYRYKDDKEMST